MPYLHSALVRALVLCLLASTAAAQTINTIAGNPARSGVPPAEIAAPFFGMTVASDPGGVLYAAARAAVYRVSGGQAILVAGNGVQGPTVPGAQAVATRFGQIDAIAVAANGDLFIADSLQSRVFRVDADTGVVSVLAGGGDLEGATNVPGTDLFFEGMRGLEVDAAGRVLLSADARVYRIDPITGLATHIAGNGSNTSSGDNGPATQAGTPCGDVTLDAAQNIYCAEFSRIRRITPGGTISTFAGTGTAGSSGNGGLALNAQITASELAAAGNVLLFAGAFEVRAINLSTTIVSPVAGTGEDGFTGDGGLALQAQLRSIEGLAAAGSSTFIGGGRRVRQVTGGFINTVAFNGLDISGHGGPALAAQLGAPRHLARDPAGNIYYATLDQVLRVSPAGTLTLIAGNGSDEGATGNNVPAIATRLQSIGGIAVDATHLYISQDSSGHRIRVVNLATGLITNFAGTGAQTPFVDNVTAANATFDSPSGLLRDGIFLYVADRDNRRIRRIDLTTNLVTTFAGNGNQHSADGPALTTGIGGVTSLAIGTLGGSIYFTDGLRVRKVAQSAGNPVASVAGNGTRGVPLEGAPAVQQPLGTVGEIAVLGSKVFVADLENQRVWVVNEAAGGTVDGFVGNGVTTKLRTADVGDFAGDGGPAGLATLNDPLAVVIDAGRVVVADIGNRRLRRIQGLENTSPIFDSLSNVTVPEDTPAVPIVIDFGDSETPTAALVMTASSSKTALVASSGLVLGPVTVNQFGGSRTLTITPQPNEVGTTVITLTLVDMQGGVTRRSFNFTTTQVNDPPTLGPIADIVASDAAPFSVPLAIGDIDGPEFNFSATSSNQALIPNANLDFNFDLTPILIMTPIAGVGGQTTVTVTLSDGSLSVSRSFVATVVVAPQAPVLTSAVIDGMVAELQWSPAASGITPLAYQIEAGTTSGATNVSASIAASARRFALLLPTTGTWFVRVRAVNGNALSVPSAEATLNVTGVPGRPRNLTAAVNGNLVTFRWTLPTNGTRTAYRLDTGTASGLSDLPSLAITPTSTALFVNASAGTTFVRLVAVNAVGASTPSNEIRLVVGGPSGPPAAPTDVQVGVDGFTAVFHWESPATGGTPSQFVLDAGSGSPGQFDLVTGIPFGTGFTFAAAAPPGTYNVRLRAANPASSGPAADELFVTLPTPALVPSAPALLRANVEVNRLVILAWTPPFAGVATSYLLEAGTAPGLANLVVFPIGAAPAFQVVAPPGTYFVRVRGVNSAGVSGVSNEIQVVVP